MTVLQKENLILEKQVHSYQTAIAQKDSKGEYDPSHMATRPQPPGQAQPGYGDTHMDRVPNNMSDPYHRGSLMPQNQLGLNSLQPNGQYAHSNSAMSTPGASGQMSAVTGFHTPGLQNHMGYDAGYFRGETNMQENYDRQPVRSHMDGGGLPIPGNRGPRSKSADPSASGYYSPTPERRPANRRNSATGTEYADHLEQNPRYNSRQLTNNYDGYRSDSDSRADILSTPNGPRYNEQYGKEGNRPRPSMRTSKPPDTRSDYGDYYSERRSKTSHEREIDEYSDRSYKSKGGNGNRNGRNQSVGDGRRNNMLNSTIPTGRASYAGYENDYMASDNSRGGSSYPTTPRASVGQRNVAYHQRLDDRRPMENGPH